MHIIETILTLAPLLLSVAFFTLAERKLIAINHNRNGPNNVSNNGILQPIADAANLLTNEWNTINTSNNSIYIITPIIGLAAYSVIWLVVPAPSSNTNLNLSILLLISVLSITIIFSISAGWSSNSKFTILGSYRSTAQAISYEVSMAIFILSIIVTATNLNSMNLNEIFSVEKIIFIPILAAWIITVIAETSRTPFDFTESESELVSGFNTEYYGVLFSIFFIAEYIALIFIVTLSTIILISSNTITIPVTSSIILIIITIIRITLPRSRYDKLIYIAWLTVIPVSIIVLTIIMII